MRFDDITDWKKKCTGCSACENICSQDAIKMTSCMDGFKYPSIEEHKCTHCGMCARVCSTNKTLDKIKCKSVYSAKAKDEHIRARGSSGGIIEILGNHIISSHGIVYGAAFDSNSKCIKHCSSEKNGISPLLRSKYVQSEIGKTFRDIGKRLKQHDTVLFVGTPCQVRGLLAYLDEKKITGNLTTVDFFCHGVPSPGVFRNLLQMLEYKYHSNVVNVTFREKEMGWRRQVTKFYFANKRILSVESRKYFYYYFFLNNYILRDSCYMCQEYCSHRADITVADYWNVPTEKDDDKGQSLVLLNTARGVTIWNQISNAVDFEMIDVNDFTYSIYSHERYDYSRKKIFMKAYHHSAFNSIRKGFFVKRYMIDTINQKAQLSVHACKKLIGLIGKGE